MYRITLKTIAIMLLTGSAVHSQITINLSAAPLPASVDNSKKQYFRPIFNQLGESCGNANGIGYTFTYEINCVHNLAANTAGNQYPYCYTYHFLNSGSQDSGASHMYVDAFQIVRENGIPNVADFGGFESGFPTKWVSGYDIYYRAMQNRVDEIDTISMLDPNGLAKLKQWLYDHGNGSPSGGVANFGCSVDWWQLETIVSGVESGKSIMTKYGTLPTGDHGQTVVGYNDSIKYDFNRDGKFTNTIDISGDGKVDMADWEVGALFMANSWGSSFGDSGFYYCPYRLLAMTQAQGGIKNENRVCIITVKQNYKPRLTLKVSLTHAQRNQIALSVGVSTDPAATQPDKLRKFAKQFNYAGGAFPMCGQGLSPTLEAGFDISDLLDSIPGATQAKFFLVADSKGGSGTVNALSLMDYTSGTVIETKSTQTNVAITTTTIVGIATTLGIAVFPRGEYLLVKKEFALRSRNGTMQVRLPIIGRSRLALYTVAGKRLSLIESATSEGWTDLPPLPIGVYLLKSRTADGTVWTGKLHVAR